MLTSLLFISVSFLAYANGANDSFKDVASLFGIGLVSGKANSGMITSIALSWLLTLPCAAVCSASVYYTAIGANLQ
jgi:PiT family inorganic phosphate transporter